MVVTSAVLSKDKKSIEVRIGATKRFIPVTGFEVVKGRDGVERELPVVEPFSVGVLVGKNGKKVWHSLASIKLKKYISCVGSPFDIGAYCPLSTINRDSTFSTISAFWDEVPDSARSRR